LNRITQFASRHPAILIFICVASIYAAFAGTRILQPSPQFHFVDLAHSWLDGRLDTDTPRQRSTQSEPDDPKGFRAAIARTEKAGGWNDWSSLRRLTLKGGDVLTGHFPWGHEDSERKRLFHATDGKEYVVDVPNDLARSCGPAGRGLCDERIYFISFPPFPAVVMLPFVAAFGYNTNDVLITVLIGGLNAVLLFWFLQLLVTRGHSRRSQRDNVILTLAFAFGTVAFFSSVRGEVWFTALIIGIALNIGFMMAALDLRHPMLAGLLLGFAFATRTPILFCGMFFAWQLLFPGNRWDSKRWRAIFGTGIRFAIPLAAVLAVLAWYNASRFGDPGEFGHAFLSGGAGERVRTHGMFSFAYLNRNLLSAFLAMPRVMAEPPYVMISNHGLGMLATTPFLFALLWPVSRPPLRIALWLAVAAAAIPGLFYQNTGWVQFGFRFALDYMPYLFALLALSDRPLDRRMLVLIAIAIAVNAFGALTFGRFPQFYYETLLPGAT
jgi:hypothetical protein